MSKSAPNAASKILLTDSATEIHSKIKTALTDSLPGISYDPTHRPGISGLLEIYSGYSGEDVQSIAARFNSADRGIREFKESCAEVVSESLKGSREEYVRIRAEDGYLQEREREGRRKASEVAQGVMHEVRALVGTD